MSFISIQPYRVLCDWQSDNAACGNIEEGLARTFDEVYEQLRAKDWRVDTKGFPIKVYCPDCKDSVYP